MKINNYTVKGKSMVTYQSIKIEAKDEEEAVEIYLDKVKRGEVLEDCAEEMAWDDVEVEFNHSEEIGKEHEDDR